MGLDRVTLRWLLPLGLAAIAGALALVDPAPAAAQPAHNPPRIARPNPVFVGVRLEYVNPLRSASGGVAQLSPLDPAVTAQAVADQAWLGYLKHDDLGGFLPAPIGSFALSSGGRDVVGLTHGQTQIPHYAAAADGKVNSFAFLGEIPPGPGDNGLAPVPGLGKPPPVVPPSNNNNPPPPNQGFGGNPTPTPGTTTTSPGTTTGSGTTTSPGGGGGGGGGGGTTTPTTTSPPPPTTTPPPTTVPPTTTTPPTTTAPTTTVGGGGGGGGSGGGGTFSCGGPGIAVESNLTDCRIYAVNMAPGDATFELMAITNTSDEPYTLSLKATGLQNQLWNDLTMGVWEVGSPAPAPLPGLLLWTTQYNPITTLSPGESIHLEIELYLPTGAGNVDQGLAAVIDFHWRATA